MDFLTPLLSILESSCSFVAVRINHVRKFNQNMQKLVSKLEELKDTRDDLKREIERAELKGCKSTKQIRGWLEKVEKAETEVNHFILVHPRYHQVGVCYRQFIWSTKYKLSKKALKKGRELSELMDNKATLNVVVRDLQQIEPVPSKPTVGLNAALQTAIQYIADDQVGLLGIYGMGGVGKTTLLKEINNEYLSRAHDFEVVIWITVSKDFSLDRIQCALLSRLGLTGDETESREQLASRIYNLMRRIKFLLLLDDLWQGLDLLNIGIPLPDMKNESKVVFTARSVEVCCDMDADKVLKVEFLSEEDSWNLFSEKVGEANVLNPHIQPYALAIVKKCGGLPLAIVTAGRAMANRKTEEEWKYSVEALNHSPSEIRGMDDVFTILKFSYDSLVSDTLKMCFLYCSLFPEEYPLEKEQLIDYWIGEGILDGSSFKGYAIIGTLKSACLLETGDDEAQVKMHDIVRSFALWIASTGGKCKEKFIVQGANGLVEAPDVDQWKESERISLLDNEITMLSGVPVCPNLSTLLLNWNCSLSKITDDFFQYMPALKVLDLSVTSIKVIPESIAQLAELRFLDLSRTQLIALPKALGCLSKLRHLDLQRTHSLTTLPSEAITGLANLRVLNMYYSYGEWWTPNGEVNRNVTLTDLQNLRNLTAIGITVTENSVLKELSEFKILSDCIQYLFIKGCEGLMYLMVASPYGGGEKLRRLSIDNCSTLQEIELGSETGKDWLPNLDVLSLHTLPNLKTIWRRSVSLNCHRNLRYIKIWYCPKLKDISWILQLPRLEKLYIFHCDEMEEIVRESEVADGTTELQFPELTTISLRGLPKLKSFSKVAINSPMLQSMAVIDCPQLKQLPFTCYDYDPSDMPVVYCSREWWFNLERDNGTASSNLLPQFIAT